jgi:two-component system, OmpR family, sensor kinase
VLLLAIVALGVPLALSQRARVNDEIRSQARAEADLIAATVSDLLSPAHRRRLASLVRIASGDANGRVLVVDRSGIVLADCCAGAPEIGVPYASRPEIHRALAGTATQLQRPSRTLGHGLLATAVPVIHDAATVGAVRITQSVAAVQSAIARVELALALIAGVVLALGLAAGRLIAGRVARPLGRLEEVARTVADGDLDARAVSEGSREQRSLSASFNEMTDRLQRLVGSQRAFVADASHELRTPLTALRLRLEEARAGGVSAEAAAHIDAGVTEVDRLAAIVEELLVLSRAGEREQPGERLAVGDLIARAAGRWSGVAAGRGLSIDAQPGAAGAVWCAAADADRALDVLIENAVHYSPPGSQVTLDGGPGRLEVLDRGPGLAPDEADAVFERFHRGSAGRAGPPGSGLGLAIARELARGWDGDVTLRNRDGGGAIGTLNLPEVPGSCRRLAVA